jgi:hypothetical protein
VTNNQTPPVQVYAWTRRFPHQFNHDQNTKGIVMNSNTNPSYGTEPTIPHTVAWQQANQHQDPYHTHISFPPQPAPPKRRNRMWGWIAALVVGSVLLCIAISALIALASPKPKRSFNDPIAEASTSKYVTQPAANPGSKMGTPTKQTVPAETVSQKNARKAAENYLNYKAFSRSGLIKQIKDEGFSDQDAAYGVDKQNANWKEQAARMAKRYLDYKAFSRQSLIHQLEYEGFTAEEAAYGVSQTGL